MPFYALTMLFTAVTSLGLGLFVWSKNKKSVLNITFGLMSLCTAGWSGGIFVQFITNSSIALIISRFSNALSIFIPVFWLHFIFALLNKTKQKKKVLIVIYALVGLTSVLVASTDLFIVSVKNALGIINFSVGSHLYVYFLLLYTALVCYGLSEIFKDYQTSSGIKKTQIKYVLIASAIGFCVGLTTGPMVIDINLYPIGLYLTWLFVPLLAYAIFKHRLFDISIILRKSIIFSLLVILVTSIYGTVVFIGEHFFQTILDLNEWMMLFLASLIIALGFSPIKQLLARLTDKIFFKKRYDQQKTIQEVSQAISSIIKLDELLSLLDQTLKKTIKISHVSLFLLDKPSTEYQEQISAKEATESKPRIIKERSPLVLHLLYTRKIVITEEIEQQISQYLGSVEDLGQIARVKEDLEKGSWAIGIPLILKNKLIGLLNLGPKLSGDAFSNTDLQLLTTLSSQTAVAVENISIYEKERRLSQAKSEFISIASHRLRTPLSAIKWALSILEEEKANLSPKQRELINKAFRSNETMIKLVNDLLNISRIEKGKSALSLSSMSIENLIEEILFGFRPALEKKELLLDFHKSEKPLSKLKIDAEKMKTALENIIGNAIIYTPQSGQISVSLKRDADGRHILLTVKDTGIGIPRAQQDQVFTRFFRADNAIAVHTEGTGLGLFIAKKIIDDHQGKIWFESKEDQGACFWVRLPLYL